MANGHRSTEYEAKHPELRRTDPRAVPRADARWKSWARAVERPTDHIRSTPLRRPPDAATTGRLPAASSGSARGGMGSSTRRCKNRWAGTWRSRSLPHHQLSDPTRLERFRREARAAARLHHTNIVPVFGVGEHDGLHYYAMQFIRGPGAGRCPPRGQAAARNEPSEASAADASRRRPGARRLTSRRVCAPVASRAERERQRRTDGHRRFPA